MKGKQMNAGISAIQSGYAQILMMFSSFQPVKILIFHICNHRLRNFKVAYIAFFISEMVKSKHKYIFQEKKTNEFQ